MKHGINKVTIVGNVGDDPRVSKTKENGNVVHLSVATNEFYKDKEGNEQQRTEWHRVVVWNKLGDLVQNFVKKGDPLYVEGKLRTNTWEDKDGVKKYSTEIYCENFLLLSPKNT